MGLEEAFASAACLIEWPERLGGMLPRDRLEVALSTDGEARRAVVIGIGAWGPRIDAIRT